MLISDLINAIALEDHELVERLLNRHARADTNLLLTNTSRSPIQILNYTLDFEFTPLAMACILGDLKSADLLLQLGMYETMVKGNGYMPLLLAIQSGNIKLVLRLLHYSANPNDKDTHGNNALTYAAKINHFNITTLLLKYKADPNLKNNEGNTALHYLMSLNTSVNKAQTKEDIRFAEAYFLYNADPNLLNIQKISPLEMAVEQENSAMVDCLLKNGAVIPPLILQRAKHFSQNPIFKKLIEHKPQTSFNIAPPPPFETKEVFLPSAPAVSRANSVRESDKNEIPRNGR